MASIPFDARVARASRSVWAGRALTGLVTLFWVADAVAKLVMPSQVTETMAGLGWPTDPATVRGLGVVMLAALGLHLWPRTAVLGAVLMTGYLGGAVATHVRVGSPLFSHALFGVYVGAMAWAGLALRDPRVRALLTGSLR